MQARAILFVFVCFSLYFFRRHSLFRTCSILVQFLALWDGKASFLGLYNLTVSKWVAKWDTKDKILGFYLSGILRKILDIYKTTQ